MAAALDRHDATIGEVVREFDGVLLKAKGEGDATVSVFRRASSAVAAAAVLPARVAEATAAEGLDLRVRVGIHTGEAHERDGDYFGPTVNRAARLRSMGAGGDVILSAATTELVHDRLPEGLVLVDLGLRELRGIARPEHAFALLPPGPVPAAAGLHAQPSRRPPFPAALRFDGVFAGRAGAVERISAHWAGARGGRRGVVFIGGEPGIGKTRLAAEVARTADQGEAIVVVGRCAQENGLAYQPVVDVVRALVPCVPPSPRIAAGLGRLLPELAQAGDGLGAVSPEAERQFMFDSVAAYIHDVSVQRPVFVVIDDLHWGATPTVMLLRHVVRSDAGSRLLVVATYRDVELDAGHPLALWLGDVARDSSLDHIRLTGLETDAVVECVEAAGHDVAEAAELHARTSGNPFFLGELLAHKGEGGDTLPDSVRDVVARRLARLSEPVNTVLRAAAIVGQHFDVDVLETVTDVDDVLDALEEASAAGLVAEDATGFVFSHALARNAIYDGLTRARRKRLHLAVAEACEANATTRPETLAHHFGEVAGMEAKAARYSLLAAQGFVDRLAFEEAAAHLERAGTLVARSSSADPELAVEIEVERLATLRLGGRANTRDDINGAVVTAFDHASAIGSARLMAEATFRYTTVFTAEDPVALRIFERALEAVGDADPQRRAVVLARLAEARFAVGDSASVQSMADEAVTLARSGGSPRALASTLLERNLTLLASPDIERRLAIAEEAVALLDSPADGRDRGRALRSLGEGHAAHYTRFALNLQRGDRAAAEADVPALEDPRTDRHLMQPWVPAPILALLDGRFDDARRDLRTWAANYAHEPAVAINYGGTVMYALHEQGRWQQRPNQPAAPDPVTGWIGPLLAALGADEYDGLTAMLDDLCADDLGRVPRAAIWPGSLCLLAQAAAAIGHAGHAAAIRDHLLPYSGIAPMLADSIAVLGAADRFIGMLDAVLGEVDEALDRLEAGLALEHDGLRAPALVARSKYWYGRTMLPRDAVRARRVLGECLATAEELGMAKVAADAAGLLARA
jgi:tetratricopeptide (TPR) repeat protein